MDRLLVETQGLESTLVERQLAEIFSVKFHMQLKKLLFVQTLKLSAQIRCVSSSSSFYRAYVVLRQMQIMVRKRTRQQKQETSMHQRMKYKDDDV